jgi:Cytochrome c oxidase subunit IV
MRTATKYLLILAAFAFLLGTVYWFVTYEVAGSVLLWALSLLPIIVAAYALRHGAFSDERTEDDPNATPAASSGTAIGSFPMGTAWPIFFVLGVVVTGAGLVYGLLLVPAGVVLIGWAVLGLMRESRD